VQNNFGALMVNISAGPPGTNSVLWPKGVTSISQVWVRSIKTFNPNEFDKFSASGKVSSHSRTCGVWLAGNVCLALVLHGSSKLQKI
jgi:hypothetical protein